MSDFMLFIGMPVLLVVSVTLLLVAENVPRFWVVLVAGWLIAFWVAFVGTVSSPS